MKLMEIDIYEDYELEEWHVVNEQVTTAQFVSTFKIFKLTVISIFYYVEKRVNFDTFLAINKSGLVFDGEIVIDSKFRTNDPNIFACGTMTKYPRRFYADNYLPKYYNQREIGKRLGQQIRAEYLQDVEYNDDNIKCLMLKTEADLPEYVEPLIVHCTLPGDIKYLAIRKPGSYMPYAIQADIDTFVSCCYR